MPVVWNAWALAVLTGAVASCSHRMLAEESAAPLGCPVEAIEIEDPNLPLEGPAWWWATCTHEEPARRYFCSRLTTELICSDVPPGEPPGETAQRKG